MDTKYYLHRISHEGNISYDLLDKKYLSLGWSKFSKTKIMEEARKPGYPNFNSICEELDEATNRSRWCMWYFAQMKEGDVVIVPQYGGLFSAYKVLGNAKSICEYSNQFDDVKGKWNSTQIIWKDEFLYDLNEDRKIDIGFLIPVEIIVENAKRDCVPPTLYSRMKIRTTSADITDIGTDVEAGIEDSKTNHTVSLYETSIYELKGKMKDAISKKLYPDQFEKLIKWYMKKCGATSVWIPAKNEPDKKDGADADIIAEFENLKHIVYIQAKKHEGTTDNWAVTQISQYKEQKSGEYGDPGYTYATWVISTADNFSSQAEEEAALKGVRLIDGEEFAKMIIDVGIRDIDKAFE